MKQTVGHVPLHKEGGRFTSTEKQHGNEIETHKIGGGTEV